MYDPGVKLSRRESPKPISWSRTVMRASGGAFTMIIPMVGLGPATDVEFVLPGIVTFGGSDPTGGNGGPWISAESLLPITPTCGESTVVESVAAFVVRSGLPNGSARSAVMPATMIAATAAPDASRRRDTGCATEAVLIRGVSAVGIGVAGTVSVLAADGSR